VGWASGKRCLSERKSSDGWACKEDLSRFPLGVCLWVGLVGRNQKTQKTLLISNRSAPRAGFESATNRLPAGAPPDRGPQDPRAGARNDAVHEAPHR
jgi:hypothetical protein